MLNILAQFKKKYKFLEDRGLRIIGLKVVDPEKKTHVIEISRPLIFDSRMIPDRFEGLKIKRRIHGNLPEEFQIDRDAIDWHKREYIWAPERFEKFTDRCFNEIKKELNDPDISSEEVLDALCFGDFQAHKEKCQRLIEQGKIPPYQDQ